MWVRWKEAPDWICEWCKPQSKGFRHYNRQVFSGPGVLSTGISQGANFLPVALDVEHRAARSRFSLFVVGLAGWASHLLFLMRWRPGGPVPGRLRWGACRTCCKCGNSIFCTKTVQWKTKQLKVMSTGRNTSPSGPDLILWTIRQTCLTKVLVLLGRWNWTGSKRWMNHYGTCPQQCSMHYTIRLKIESSEIFGRDGKGNVVIGLLKSLPA